MRDKKATFAIAGVLFIVTLFALVSNSTPTASQDSPPVGYLPYVSYQPIHYTYFPIMPSIPTPTPTPRPTATPKATPPPTATPTRVPSGPNLLPNPSFENGWYHPNNIPELQIPVNWVFVWEEGFNPLAPEDWNRWVRPEVRHLSRNELPPQEHDLFIWEGNYTVKPFKDYGAVSYQLKTTTFLAAGRYQLEINAFPDMVTGYTPGGQKIWATDPKTSEVRLTAEGQTTGWIFPSIGQKNTIRHTFTVNQGKVVEITAAFRGRWAIRNNGWFLDDWRLTKLAG